MKTYEVLLRIRAECIDDAEELINDYTGEETDVEIIDAKEVWGEADEVAKLAKRERKKKKGE